MNRCFGRNCWLFVCCATLIGCAGTQPVEPPDEAGGIDVAAPATGGAGVAAASDQALAGPPASAPQPMAAGASGGAAGADDAGGDQDPVDEFADVPSAASAMPQESEQGPDAPQPDESPPVEEPTAGDGDVAEEPPPVEVTDDPPAETVCGDGVIEGDEECEGANLNGMRCETLSAGAGLLGCDLLTCRFDTSLCIPPLLRCGRFGCAFPTFP